MTRGIERLGLKIERQGHIHIEIIHLVAKRHGVRRWYIQTEQKRPDAFASSSVTIEEGRRRPRLDEHEVFLTARNFNPSDTLYWRDGEDGETSTILTLLLPRPLRRSKNWSLSVENDKWGVFVTAVLDQRVGYWGKRRRSWWAP